MWFKSLNFPKQWLRPENHQIFPAWPQIFVHAAVSLGSFWLAGMNHTSYRGMMGSDLALLVDLWAAKCRRKKAFWECAEWEMNGPPVAADSKVGAVFRNQGPSWREEQEAARGEKRRDKRESRQMETVGRWRDTGYTECMFWTCSNRQSTHYAMTHRPTKSLSPCRVCPSVCLKLCLCLFAGLYHACVCLLIRPSVLSPKPPHSWKFIPRSLSPSAITVGFQLQYWLPMLEKKKKIH